MRLTVLLPGPLHAYAGGRETVELLAPAASVGDALGALFTLHPALRDRVLREDGRVRPHVNVFVGRESIRHTGGLETPVEDGAEIAIFPAVSGG
jgi:molybdopterin converting factor small subunit